MKLYDSAISGNGERKSWALVFQWMFFEQYSHEPYIATSRYSHVSHEGGFALDEFPAIRRWIERARGQPGFVPMG